MIEYNKSLYVSENLSVREELLKHHHNDSLAKHFDADKISELLNCKYYWKSMIKNVKEYINTCDICQRVKMKRHLSYDELRSLSRLTNSWKEITMNFITDLSSSKWKQVVYDSILVIVDYYMKMTRYLSTKKTLTVIKLAELFFEKIALRYETSSDIVIDRDSLFISAFWSKICYHVKVKRWLSIAFHLQTDDQTERQNQTLKHYLRVYCFEKQDDWATLLLIVEFVYHQTKLNWSLSRVFISTFWFDLITRYQSSDLTRLLDINLLTRLDIDFKSEFDSNSRLDSSSNWKWHQMSRFTISESITSLYLKDFRATNKSISLLIVCIILLHYQ